MVTVSTKGFLYIADSNGWGEFKFKPNKDDWIASSIAAASQAASAATLPGTTIKLYPTRKTSDKIYCTVE